MEPAPGTTFVCGIGHGPVVCEGDERGRLPDDGPLDLTGPLPSR